MPRCVFGSSAGAKNAQSCQRTTGSASMKPATMLSFSEVVNGSATPKVISLRCVGGSVSISTRRIRVVEHVGHDRPDEDGSARDEDARAELVEVVDERGLLAVPEALRQPGH